MSYIGNQPTSTAFVTDTFSGNGTTTAFTMSVAPAGTTSLLVAITGVVQDPSAYSVAGTTLTFSAAPPSGTGNISVRYLGIPASGVTTTAYRTVTEFTATAGQTTFTPPSYTVGYLNVYRNGVLLGSADYTATNGTTVVLAAAASAGDLVTTESFYVSSVLNALPQTGGTVSGNMAVVGTVTTTSGIGTNGANPSGTSFIAGRIDASSEGGQIDLCRSTDNTSAWALDVYGSTSTPSLRFVDNVAAAARLTIDSTGNLNVNTSNAGIVFNKSGALTNSTLNDYEVGTWTPTVSGQTSAGTGTYTSQAGTYVKIGQSVTITFTVVWSAHTGTGFGRLTNLPFTSSSAASVEWLNLMEVSSFTLPASSYPVILMANGGLSYCGMYTATVGTGGLNQLTLDTAAGIYGSLTYQTAS